MTNSGGFAVSRSHRGDRFYNPPPMRRHHQQLQKAPKAEAAASEVGSRTDSHDSATALSKPQSVCSSASAPPKNVTNLDRLMESVTPFVPAQHFSKVNVRGQRTREAGANAFFCLEDLWESFQEWSVYGVGVPLLLNEKDQIIQYYVPFLSGIQLYIDPLKSSSRLRSNEESDVESSRESSCGGSSDCEADRQSKSADLKWNQQNHLNANAQQLNRISLRDKSALNLSADEVEINKSPGALLFEYLEQEQPYNRRPLTDKIMDLASQYPELKKCRSCDLMPSSWISVAWYPIYRIPIGHTLRDLDASFLTFHFLSTQSRVSGSVQPQFHGANGRSVHGMIHAASKISLPVFGLASYKLKGSLVSPFGPRESKQENSLLLAADDWLRSLKVFLPDYQFFLSHYSQWR
ncbi:PREDICTED: uncharacterized protein LOC109191264 isoform X2 [Ipomoea nil]|uniref:uncharacterized protein LOC109191264 isoform X2 n=1 Tax=Ipomoea nil TaxID=35883 RepID=UPI0009017AA5|nr:PREDICTED: uncharacterized protein LOC109191264 isoform X2 [Ipomoea nil]